MEAATIPQLEAQLEDCREAIAKRDLALKLEKNRDFKKLILDDFCTYDCARYAQNSTNHLIGEQERADSLGTAQAAGYLRRYLSAIIQMGNYAESKIPEIEEAIAEMRSEDA